MLSIFYQLRFLQFSKKGFIPRTVSDQVKSHAKDPFVVKKAEEDAKTILRVGLPGKKRNKAFEDNKMKGWILSRGNCKYTELWFYQSLPAYMILTQKIKKLRFLQIYLDMPVLFCDI